jgi:hypothetical protein
VILKQLEQTKFGKIIENKALEDLKRRIAELPNWKTGNRSDDKTTSVAMYIYITKPHYLIEYQR